MITKKLKLRNGTQALFAPMHGTDAVTVLILFPVGSRHETRSVNGGSHFIEHLFFKGTTNRPTTLEVSKELDGVGAEYNAFTSKDHTGYYVKVSYDRLELALDILSDMLYRSLFDPKEIERERGVIVEEINMYDDNPMMLLDELYEELVFRGNTLGWKIAGPRKVIRNVTRKQLLDYKAKHYTPSNLLLTVAGKFNQPKADQLVRRYFGTQRGPRRVPHYARFHGRQTAPRVSLKFRETEQVQIGFGFPSFRLEDPRMPALSVLSVILGGNMSSRLFINIRERLGLAYFIRSEASAYQDVGTFLVRAGLDKTRIQPAIRKIWDELSSLRTNGVTDEELTRAKDFLKGKIVLSLEDSEEIADWVGKQQLLKGKVETPEQKIEKIRRVTAEEVRQVAVALFRKERINLALIGPFRSVRDFEKLVRQLP